MKNYLKKINPLTLIVSTVFILSGCNSKSKEAEFLRLHPDKIVSMLSDSSYFGNVWDVNCYGNQLLITDRTANRLVLCDTSFHIIKSIGREGNGPGELMEPMHNCIKDNYIYTFDNGNKALSVFSMEGQFVKKIKYITRLIPFYRFALDDSLNVYICNDRRSGSTLAKLDTSDRRPKPFGQSTGSSLKEEWAGNEIHVLLSNEGQLICVGTIAPVIEIYTKDGKKIKEFNLTGDPYLKSSLDYAEREFQKDRKGGRIIIFYDVYLVGSHLYLLLTGHDKLNQPNCEKILVYAINSKELQFVKALDLGDGKNRFLYNTFAVSEDEKRIFTYVGTRNEWHVFSIP